MTESDLGQTIQRMFQEVIIGKAYLSIARGLSEKLHEDPALAKTASTFFTLSLAALMGQSQLCAARLFDRSGDSLSVYEVLRRAEGQIENFKDATPEEALSAIREARKQMKAKGAVLRRLKVRRDKVIAHLDLRHSQNPDEFAEQIKLSYGELEQLFKLAGDILNDISGRYMSATSMLEPLDLHDYRNALELIAKAKRTQIAEYEERFGTWPHPEFRPKDSP